MYDIDRVSGLIYMKDIVSEFFFLVDTDAARCTFPRKKVLGYANRVKDKHFYMIAANGTTVDTYGSITVYLNLGCKWQSEWQFIVADIISPVIGMDILQYHGYLWTHETNASLNRPNLPTKYSATDVTGDSTYHISRIHLPTPSPKFRT
jgi:hypothetical protein